MKRNKKVIGVSCFVLLLLVGIMYVYVHPVNRYRLEVTRVGGSGYGYKIYERAFDNCSTFFIGTIMPPYWHDCVNMVALECQYDGTR